MIEEKKSAFSTLATIGVILFSTGFVLTNWMNWHIIYSESKYSAILLPAFGILIALSPLFAIKHNSHFVLLASSLLFALYAIIDLASPQDFNISDTFRLNPPSPYFVTNVFRAKALLFMTGVIAMFSSAIFLHLSRKLRK